MTRRCQIIPMGVDARAQRYPDEPRFVYQPLAGREDDSRWNEANRKALLHDYNVHDFYI